MDEGRRCQPTQGAVHVLNKGDGIGGGHGGRTVTLAPGVAHELPHRESVSSLLSSVLAQETAVSTLKRALAAGRVHHAYLFDGPEGVGKERGALGLAQALVCEQRGSKVPPDDACGVCSACRRVPLKEGEARPAHPDVAILERGLYEPAQIGRRTPETQDLSIDQVRSIVLARAAFPPHEERAKVFVVRRAEELSVPAANALLKTLEEPGPNTYFILLSSQPDALLSTIRSRTQRLRFAALPDKVVGDLLVARGVPQERARSVARQAHGSMAAAVLLADDERSAARDAFVKKAMDAVLARTLAPALDLADDAKKAKADLEGLLRGLAEALAHDARTAAMSGAPGSGATAADVLARRYAMVLTALQQLDGNASAQLVVEALVAKMRSA